jgi:hypothetical protein
MAEISGVAMDDTGVWIAGRDPKLKNRRGSRRFPAFFESGPSFCDQFFCQPVFCPFLGAIAKGLSSAGPNWFATCTKSERADRIQGSMHERR